MENSENFSQYISKYFIKRGSTLDYCKKFYPNENPKYKSRVLLRYLNGERIPSFEDAQTLLKNLGEELSSEDIVYLLDKSKEFKNEFYSPPLFCKNLNVTYSDIDKQFEYSNINSSEMLEDRFNQLDVKNAKEYLLKLIKKDLEESIL